MTLCVFSSVGRAADSKSAGREFEPLKACIFAPILSCFTLVNGIDKGVYIFPCYIQDMYMWWISSIAAGQPDLTNMVSISGTRTIPTFYIDRFEYPNQEGVLPLASLSLSDAQSLCAEQGKRLCTSAEDMFRRSARVKYTLVLFAYDDTRLI